MSPPGSPAGPSVPVSTLLALAERWEAQGRPYADCSEPAALLMAVAAELRQLLPAAGAAAPVRGPRHTTSPEDT